MNDRIQVFVSSVRLQSEFVVIFLKDMIKCLFPTLPNSLKNEVILVTRGSNGPGREILRRLAQVEHDFTLISWDVNEEANRDVVKELKDLGVKRVMAYNVDVTNRDQVSKAAAEICRNYGDVTMLLNNAGAAGPAGPCWQIDINHPLTTVDINLNSHLYTVQEFLPAMLRSNRGLFVGTCCIMSFLKGSHGSPCHTSKGSERVALNSLRRRMKLKDVAFANDDVTHPSVWRCPF